MSKVIANLVDISNDDTRYVQKLHIDYIQDGLVHLISTDGNWEVNFVWQDFMNTMRQEVSDLLEQEIT